MTRLEDLLCLLRPGERVVLGRSLVTGSQFTLADGRGHGFRGERVEDLAAPAIARRAGRHVPGQETHRRLYPEPELTPRLRALLDRLERNEAPTPDLLRVVREEWRRAKGEQR